VGWLGGGGWVGGGGRFLGVWESLGPERKEENDQCRAGPLKSPDGKLGG